MGQTEEEQNRLILDQFTRQAEPFARLPAHATDESIRLACDAAGVGPDDIILDVGCGPGLVACAFAATARHVTGIDPTPAMIEQARALQREGGLENLSWHVGDVSSVPFADDSFSVALTRYSFHHLLDPGGVLSEMIRVTEPGGRVVVVDVYTSGPEQAEAYDHVERLRDPSHVRALGLDELGEMFHDAGLGGVARTFSRLDVDLEDLLGSCFPEPGDDQEVRRIFAADIGRDRLGVGARREGGRVRFASPVVALTGRKPL